ncbi:MAG: hypothetical protein HGB36_00355 [Chlorobiaceae bacterium]|jgi:hypothetical protein|nr:hypothetical protein [Chlorobiaceae bacterium]
MGISQTVCTIDTSECALIGLESSGGAAYRLTGCKTFPFGIRELLSEKGKRLLKKIVRQIGKMQSEEIVLCIAPETYLPLPAYFPADADPSQYQELCRMEAEHFLNQPDDYNCDVTGYGELTKSLHEKKLLLFYPAEPCRTVSDMFSADYRVRYSCSPHLSLLQLSMHGDTPLATIELENNYFLISVSKHGRLEKFICRQVRSREEAIFFTIKELSGNPLLRETGVQITGTRVDKALVTLIGKETSLKTKPLGIPSSIPISNLVKFSITSPAAVKAISTALMAFTEGTIAAVSK